MWKISVTSFMDGPLRSSNLLGDSRFVLLDLGEHAAGAEGAVGTGGAELRLGVLAEEGGDAGEVRQVLEYKARM